MLLSNERARKKTFATWPHQFPRKQCMAYAGFFYTGERDYAQCVFCQGVLGHWRPAEDPVKVHRNHFPRCPLLTERPLVNVAQRNDQSCCSQHKTFKRFSKNRLTPENNPSGFNYYILTILVVLLSIGITPKAYGASAVNDVITPLTTWKGVVAVKQQEVLAPVEYTTAILRVDWSTCRSAEDKLHGAITLLKTTARTGNSIPDDLRTAAGLALDEMAERLRRKVSADKGLLSETLDTLTATANLNNTQLRCATATATIFKQTDCKLLQHVADTLKAGFAAASNTNGLPAVLGLLSDTVTSYSDLLDKLRRFTDENERDLANTNLQEMLSSSCLDLYSSCTSPPEMSVRQDLAKLASISSVKRSGPATNVVDVEINVPCYIPSNIQGQYRLYTFPYAENGTFERLKAPSSEVWMKEGSQGSEKEFLITDPVCTKTEGTKLLALPPICQEMEGPLQPLEITGSTSDINLTLKKEISEPDVEIVDMADNQYLIYAPANTEAIYKCPNRDDEVTMLDGLSAFSPAIQCSLTIGAYLLKHLPWEKARRYFLPSTLTFKSGHLTLLKEVIQQGYATQMLDALWNLTTHLKTYWPAYTAAVLAFWGLVICLIITCVWRKSRRPHGVIRALDGEEGEEMGTTYVVERARRQNFPI